ncbi:MAG TPA: nucleotidyltransferase domain-containing protein [Oscillatoriaceae cyanobacterium M33_DOE_052]|uniref:Nucleotidyltransferase n=1 Tax=Planktothricoides sp. SpSt-374 TaxID=2282167 RepID=A0A7C3ZYC1_9CYAN|nr:nucleotidyltransferase domain-containing protein [Oscillatoriaceae cyanobacterium M33_DOE_052]
MIGTQQIQLSMPEITAFCHKWRVTEFALFGSVLREDFNDQSDIDVLVSFTADSPWTILDLVVMEQELAAYFNRDVDLVEKQVIEKSSNTIRKANILNSAQVIYALQ